MTPNPILRVLSTLTSHRVQHLLMGGQACVFYGAAEFSRDTDVVLLADADNLDRLSFALGELEARRIAVPPLSIDYLRRGHAVHFRCGHPEARDMRVDVMSVLRGVDAFAELWDRRTTIELAAGVRIELMSLPDLVLAKKTQRDKDWPMIRRLVEAHFARHQMEPVPEQVDFWLRESRTPSMLLAVAQRHPERASVVAAERPLIALAAASDAGGVEAGLEEEERRERAKDRAYWAPLRRELEVLRHGER